MLCVQAKFALETRKYIPRLWKKRILKTLKEFLESGHCNNFAAKCENNFKHLKSKRLK